MAPDEDDFRLLSLHGLNGKGFYLPGAERAVPRNVLDNDRPFNEALFQIAKDRQAEVARQLRELPDSLQTDRVRCPRRFRTRH